MKKSLTVLACCLAISAMLAFAQNMDEGYQPAHIVSIDKMAANAEHMSDSDRYKIAMRMNDTLYKCEASGSASLFMGWAPGKDFPAKLNEKTLLVKSPNGQIAELTVKSKKVGK
jgi:hypothetical protein